MPHKKTNKHDSFFKSLLSQKDMAMSFFEEYLPAPISGMLDLGTLALQNTSYLSGHLKTAFSDVVWRVSTKDHTPIHISLLLEHKSYPDNFVAFQLLEYLALAYRKQAKPGKDPEVIIPILYYHGNRKWSYKSLPEHFSIYPNFLRNFIPHFESLFINLREMPQVQIQNLKNGMLRSAIMLQKHYFDPQELNRNIRNIVESLHPYLDSNSSDLIFVYMIQNSNIDRKKLIQVVEDLPPTLNARVMSIYDELIQEGIEKGIERGIERGIEKGRTETLEKFVKKLLTEFGFTDEQAALAAETSTETVQAIRKKIL